MIRAGAASIALSLATLFLTDPISAQDLGDPVRIETRAFGSIRAGVIRVDFRDNTELNSRLAPEIERELTQRGFVLRHRPSMLLDFRTTVVRRDPGGVGIRFYGEGGNQVGLDDFRVGIDLPDRDRTTRAVHYEIVMELIDRDARQIVWSGTAAADVVGSDRFRVISGLARRLVGLIGQTADQKGSSPR
jgi:hypothetical protein